MAGRLIDLETRVAQWSRAFAAVRTELTPDAMRQTLAAMEQVDGIAELSSYMSLARNVMENDRIAAQVAARLLYGVRPDGED